ncbi:uncharacterized protein VNE69_12054 [Vairimorpha necatrix]|uniref:Uncharacterized protein n=1 Tax=Vairimorpha necatrix TaxID=6039 RepID=A0AAX4JGK3_9MICR
MALIITENISNKTPLKSSSSISSSVKYILFSLDLDIIEYFYINNLDLYITNINIEYLLFKVSKFKYLEIKVEGNKTIDRLQTYNKVVSKDPRGLEISFSADIYRSVYTSLYMPSAYYHESDINIKIFQYIVKNKEASYEEIEKHCKEDIRRGMNNLLYTEVIIKKNNLYKVNEILKI